MKERFELFTILFILKTQMPHARNKSLLCSPSSVPGFAQPGVVPGAFPGLLWEQMWDGKKIKWLLPTLASSMSERVDYNVSTGQFMGLKQQLHRCISPRDPKIPTLKNFVVSCNRSRVSDSLFARLCLPG